MSARYSVAVMCMLAGVPACLLFAQGAPMPHQGTAPTAPMPAILSNTRGVFLANAGDQENADCLSAYNAFYAGLQRLNRFTLVDDPAKADLVVELHYEIAFGQGKLDGAPRQFRLGLIDARSHTLVWSLTERTNYAVFQKNRDRNLATTVNELVGDFTALVSDAPKPPSNDSKVRH